MTEQVVVPNGYWERADGALIPLAKIQPIDKDRTKTVTRLCELAKEERDLLAAFKSTAMAEVLAFVERSLADYDVAYGGKKGNITLITFDGKYKIIRQMQESLIFDERLQAAKLLIDECITTWSKTTNANIKVLVNDAFQVDQAGKINTGRVLGLRRLKISDEKWELAMKAISDSIQVSSTKPYIRFYERNALGEYDPISLDAASL